MNKRYERKFFLPHSAAATLETIIKLHPLFFREIYYKRSVHNIYYDTHDFEFYKKNVDGNSNRMKIRLRWYDHPTKIKNPQLEFKLKTGLLGTKNIILANSFELTKIFPELNQIVSQTDDLTTQKLKSVKPVLMNTYERKYFQSEDTNFRLTIDTNLKFYKVSHSQINWKSAYTLPGTVLELKYDQENDELADQVSSFFPFRMSKSSKYVMGISKLYDYDY